MKYKYPFFLAAFIMTLSSCSTDNADYPKPAVTGKIGEVLVVMDGRHWNSEAGDTLRSILEREYPMLPQIEKSFNVLHIEYSSFLPAMQRIRNIVMVTISDEYPTANVYKRKDPWATPQVLLSIVAPDVAQAAKAMHDKRETMLGILEQAEIDRQTRSAKIYADHEIGNAVLETFGVQVSVPKGYRIMNKKSDFIWIESRSNYSSTGIIIYTFPFDDINSINPDFLINKCDDFLKKNVPGERDSSRMTISKYVYPTIEIPKGADYIEMRGLWELVNDYMGGPFVTRFYIDATNKKITAIKGYVYAPRYDKRDYLRRVEGIVNSFAFPGTMKRESDATDVDMNL